MHQTERSHLVAAPLVVAGGLLVTLAALERLSSPSLRALGGRELLIMAGLLIVGVVNVILGACGAAGSPLLPGSLPSVIACLGVFAAIDVVRIVADSFRWYGDPAGPLAAVPSSNNWMMFVGGVLTGGGGVLLALGHLGVFPRTQQQPDLSKTKTGDFAKTYHANRWWMRDGSGSVLVWNDQAQAWSPWVHGRDPGLPPGWS